MLKKPLPAPSPGELELLRILWRMGAATVKQIHGAANRNRTVAKSLTTTLKLIQVMEQKGLVKREGKGRPFQFRAMVSEKESKQHLLKDIVKRGFQGSAKDLVLCVIETADISQEELNEIRALITARQERGK